MKLAVLNYVFILKILVFVLDFVCVQPQEVKEDLRKVKALQLALQWAPKVWIQENEKFLPFNVEAYLKEMTLINPTDENSCNFNSALSTELQLPLLDKSWGSYLHTKQNIKHLLKNKSSFLYGANPSKTNVPVYAYFRWCDANFDHFLVHYWFFFSFNEGKKMCSVKGLPIPMDASCLRVCLGKKKYFGRHVGDWEEVIMEFKNSDPVRMHLSVHSVGVKYHYNKETNLFILPDASKKGITEIKNPPKSVQVIDGHPVIYAAEGSHAFWASAGKHTYTRYLTSIMTDETDEGVPWESWRDLRLFHSPETTPSWYHYYGKWGNRKSDCFLNTGICLLNDGPPGLGQRQPKLQC